MMTNKCRQGASKYVANLIQMVFDYGRIDCMVAIIDEFERHIRLRQKRLALRLS